MLIIALISRHILDSEAQPGSLKLTEIGELLQELDSQNDIHAEMRYIMERGGIDGVIGKGEDRGSLDGGVGRGEDRGSLDGGGAAGTILPPMPELVPIVPYPGMFYC